MNGSEVSRYMTLSQAFKKHHTLKALAKVYGWEQTMELASEVKVHDSININKEILGMALANIAKECRDNRADALYAIERIAKEALLKVKSK